MVTEDAGKYVVNIGKKRREDRIFPDYPRNDRAATAFAPLSPRMRPDGTGLMPLACPQASTSLDLRRLTSRTVPSLALRRDPSADYQHAADL